MSFDAIHDPAVWFEEFSMEYKDPMHELLSSLEQIVFKDETQKITLTHRTTSCTEIEQLWKGTGLKIDDFARVLGVSVAMVKEWESRRVKPSSAVNTTNTEDWKVVSLR